MIPQVRRKCFRVKKFIVLSFLFLSVALPAFAAEQFPFTGETTSDHVNVRAGLSNNYEVLAVVGKGERLAVLGKKYSWYKVRLPDGAKAYVKAEYVLLINPSVGEVLADRINVRAAPNTSATVLGQITKGKKFSVKESLPGGWIWIRPVDEAAGWVHESLLVFKGKQVPALPTPEISSVPAPVMKKIEPVKLVEKPLLVKTLANGEFECSGQLLKVEGGPAAYKVVRENATVCLVDGPASVIDRFMNNNIVVQGKLKGERKPQEDPVVAVSKIKLAI